MNLKYLLLVPVLALTACAGTVHKDPVHNPQGLSDRELIREQVAKIEAMDREMEKRENELKYQHLKELTQMQAQQKHQMSQGHINCKFFCF